MIAQWPRLAAGFPKTLLVCFLCFVPGLASAQSLQISAARVRGPGWQLQHLQVDLQTQPGKRDRLRVQTGALETGKQLVWQVLQARCALQTLHGWTCPSLQMTLSGSPWGSLQGAGRSQLLQAGGQGSLGLQISGPTFGKSNLQIHSAASGYWQLRALGNLPVAGWASAGHLLPAGWQSGGQIRWQVHLTGSGWTQINALRFALRLDKGQFSSPDGLQAAQNVAATMRGEGQWRGHWQGHVQMRWTQGALLWSPWYWTAPVRPVALRSAWQQSANNWRLEHGSITWPDLGAGKFALSRPVQGGALQWQLRAVDVAMEPLFITWIKPLLPATSFATGASLAGHLRFSVVGGSTLQSLSWHLQNGDFSAPDLSLQAVNSRGAWSAQVPTSTAQVTWQRASLYRIPLGSLRAQAVLHPGGFALKEPLQVNLLGGVLRFQKLSGNWAGPHSGFSMSGALQGLSMNTLTRLMHWPPFTGSIHASIPELTYHAGNLRTSGVLSAGIFGGKVQVSDLRIEHFLGVMPLLRANVAIQGLQLKPLTDAFHFGYISGVLEGQVRNLYLLNWSPEAFQAQFHTLKTPGISQKISYQAVQSITKLGGGDGISGFFQGMFLRLFKTFNYSQLGMGIHLADGVAELSGVHPENGGFVILQGQGLPRVDIVGYNRRVSWGELLARLKTAMETGPEMKTGE